MPRPRFESGRYTKELSDRGFTAPSSVSRPSAGAQRMPVPRVNTYVVRFAQGLDILEFPEMSEEWLDFIVACRHGESHSHDVVIGAMADDQIYNYVSEYIEGAITREQFWALAKFKYPTHQIAFCTDRALESLEFVNCEEVGDGRA